MKTVKPVIAIAGAAALTLGIALSPAVQANSGAPTSGPSHSISLASIQAEVGTHDTPTHNARTFYNGYRHNCPALIHDVSRFGENFVAERINWVAARHDPEMPRLTPHHIRYATLSCVPNGDQPE